MTLFFSDKNSWGRTTIMPVIGTVTIAVDGTLETDSADCDQLIDNITIFDHDNMPSSDGKITVDEIEIPAVNLDEYTHDDEVVFSTHDKELLKKALNFLDYDQLVELVEKIGLVKPKSEKKHVVIQLLYKKMDAATWKGLLVNIFDTFTDAE